MSNIGPNSRPPWQQPQPNNQRPTQTTAPADASVAPTGQGAGGSVSNGSGNMPSQGSLAGLLTAGLSQDLALGSGQLLQLLRSLLQMPKELAQLMALLADADPTTAQAMLQTLLDADVPIPLDQLQHLLLSHADAAQDKLVKLLQTSGLGVGGHPSQMGEVLSTLGELVNQAKQSPGQALHATINLYLPYYPLHPPQAFSLRYESPGGQGEGDGEAGGQEGEQLALYMDTLSLGQFKITLAAQGASPLKAIVIHEAAAVPFEREISQQVAKGMGGEARIDLAFVLQEGAKAHLTQHAPEISEHPMASQPSSEGSQQSVGLHPTGGLSMAALYGAYVLIRVIFELDEQNKLHQQRAKM